MKKLFLVLLTITSILLLLLSAAFAGTTVINVQQEEGGEIHAETGSAMTNMNGAMFWDGSKWCVNDTYAHMFFSDLRTGERLKDYAEKTYDLTEGSGPIDWQAYAQSVEAYNGTLNSNIEAQQAWDTAYGAAYSAWLNDDDPDKGPWSGPSRPGAIDQFDNSANLLSADGSRLLYSDLEYVEDLPGGYRIEKRTYSYTKSSTGEPGGLYGIDATEYTIIMPDGRKVVCMSRSTGASNESFFNIFVEDPENGISAMRGDPVWMHYNAGTTLEEAKDTWADRKGDLPTLNSTYSMDVNGGSDMGGMTYSFNTEPRDVSDILTLGNSAFASDFTLKYTDSSGNLQSVTLKPSSNSVFIPPVTPGDGGDGGSSDSGDGGDGDG